MSIAITALYYLLCAVSAGLLVRNFIKDRDWQKAVLQCVVLLPFLLRLLRLK